MQSLQKDRNQDAERLLILLAKGQLDELGDEHPHTQESLKLLVNLCNTLNQPEEAEKWRAKLIQTEAVEE